MKTNLRPCPFCNGEFVIAYAVGERKEKFGEAEVCCTTCGTSITRNCDHYSSHKATDEAAITHWNTRPIEDGLRAEIEKLKAVLMDIWHITKEELDEENAILETRGDYMQRLERNINRIETITRKELDKECGQ